MQPLASPAVKKYASQLNFLKVLPRLPACQRVSSRNLAQRPATTFLRYWGTLLERPTRILLPTHKPWQLTRTYSSQFTDIVFPDPNRSDLFYHFVHPPTPVSNVVPAYALSFLSSTPPALDSPAILGWLPAQTYTTNTPEMEESQPKERTAALHHFKDNPKFIKLLHSTIKSALREGLDDIWTNSAIQYQNGWMHINDQRNIPSLDRVGSPDDIIASVLVTDGQMNVDTYQPMPSYRICTSDGVLQLTPGLARHLEDALTRLTKETPIS